MKNSNGNSVTLRNSLDNIVQHYRNVHTDCHASSRCKQQNYAPSRNIIRSERAAELLANAIKSTIVYKDPEKYAYCRDTHYIESFHNTILSYLDKRIHFKNLMYCIRIGLAICDWNENVDQTATSMRNPVRVQNPRRRTSVRVLKPKSYQFVTDIWNLFSIHVCSGNDNIDDDVEDIDIDSDDDDMDDDIDIDEDV